VRSSTRWIAPISRRSDLDRRRLDVAIETVDLDAIERYDAPGGWLG